MSAETKVVYYVLDESNLNIVCYACEEHQPEEVNKIIDKYLASLSENSTKPKFRNIKISGASCDLCKRKQPNRKCLQKFNEDKFVNLDHVFSIETMKIGNKYVCKFHVGDGLEETSKAFETESEARRQLRETVLQDGLRITG